jgi:hypothetical protein
MALAGMAGVEGKSGRSAPAVCREPKYFVFTIHLSVGSGAFFRVLVLFAGISGITSARKSGLKAEGHPADIREEPTGFNARGPERKERPCPRCCWWKTTK